MYNASYIESLRPVGSYDPRSTVCDSASSSFHLPLSAAHSLPYFQGQVINPTVVMKNPYFTRATDALMQINMLRSNKQANSSYPPYLRMLPAGGSFDVLSQSQSTQGSHLSMKHYQQVAQHNAAVYSLQGPSVPIASGGSGEMRVLPPQGVQINNSSRHTNPQSTRLHFVPPSLRRGNPCYAGNSFPLETDTVGSDKYALTVSPRLSSTKQRSTSIPCQTPHYPPHFARGSVIQLACGRLKRVEELLTSDFVESASLSDNLLIDSSTVVHMRENHEHNTVILGFSVGDKNIQVGRNSSSMFWG